MEDDNLTYNPEPPVYYNYKSTEQLNLTCDDINLCNYKYMNICCYDVNMDGKYPFLKFLLLKNVFMNILLFPKITILNNSAEELIDITKLFIQDLLLITDYDNFNKDIVVKGFYEYNNELFLFIDLTKCKVAVDDIYSTSKLWFVLIDEIFNNKYVCNIRIDSSVFRFFNNNYKFCILLDENNEAYEIPMIGYVGRSENKLNFTYTFGVTSEDQNAILGPYYYFTSYQNAVKEGYYLSEKSIQKKGGIVRFALFTCQTKHIENFPNDEIDTSDIKEQRLNDDNLDKNIEHLTMRISDHEGKWAETADCCYVGQVQLENGMFLPNTPLIVLKEYNQQVPLSYHYIDNLAFEKTKNIEINNINTYNYYKIK